MTATALVRLAHAVKRCRNVMSSGAMSDVRMAFRMRTAESRSLAVAHACSSALNAHVSSVIPRAFIPASASPAAATSPTLAYAVNSAMNE